jgi:AraC family transcriptional regulator of adaptative response / DNA-3-methyladenine glycosylase II
LLFSIIERVRAMFDLDADWATIETTLKTDPLLAGRIAADPGRRVTGCFDSFELTARAILQQRSSVSKTSNRAGKMVSAFGRRYSPVDSLTHIFPTPETLAHADLEGAGIPKARADSIRAVARATCAGRIRFDRIGDTADFLQKLGNCPGIGAQTINYIAMRVVRDTDAFPLVFSELSRALKSNDPLEVQRRSQAWRPWRAYAALYLAAP